MFHIECDQLCGVPRAWRHVPDLQVEEDGAETGRTEHELNHRHRCLQGPLQAEAGACLGGHESFTQELERKTKTIKLDVDGYFL